MTGVAFLLFTNYMITDPGTTPSKGRAQFIFGGAVAGVYAVLMQANIVYTLFFAVVIVCGLRGGGWWAVHLYQKYRTRRQAQLESATSAVLVPEPEKVPVG
jgi:nitrate reductase alpha subunit